MAAFIDNIAIRAIFAQPLSDGQFEKSVRVFLRSVAARRPVLLLAFAPKCAGTYFPEVALQALNGRLTKICRHDGTLYLPSLLAGFLDGAAPPTVAHIHMKALGDNRRFIETAGLKPIIMIRNIADMLASLLDTLEVDPTAVAAGLHWEIPKNVQALDRGTKLNFLLEVLAPWYATYFASWKRFVDDAPETVCVLRYKELRTNPAETLYRALSHAGFATSRFDSLKAVEQMRTRSDAHRFNMGVAGRGRDYFSGEQLARLQRLLSYYPQLSDWMPELLPEKVGAESATQRNRRIAI